MAYIDEKIVAYETMLDECDKEEDRAEIEEKIKYQNKKKENYQNIKKYFKRQR
jgi:hypothetical protein